MAATVAVLALAALIAGCRREPVSAPGNSLLVIAPYRHAGTWVFDEPRRGLKQEPFVTGIPEMIDRLVADIPGAEKGFRLIFSARAFPGSTHSLLWRREQAGGNWYYCPQLDAEGWLCPALLKFFGEAPGEIHLKAEAK